MQSLAIYDMDKTITRWPTWTPFLVQAALTTAPWRLALLPVVGLLALAYALRAIDRARLKELTQAVMLGRSISPQRAQAAARRFAALVIRRGIYRGARAQMAADRAEGRRIVMATASFRFYAREIAERLGMDDVIATELVYDENGRLMAQIAGENCYGPAKLQMIEAWIAAQGWQRRDVQACFYSDHVSDAPTLAWADQGVAINPHPPLRAIAAERGWQIIDWTR